jgi:hypothetical protein
MAIACFRLLSVAWFLAARFLSDPPVGLHLQFVVPHLLFRALLLLVFVQHSLKLPVLIVTEEGLCSILTHLGCP